MPPTKRAKRKRTEMSSTSSSNDYPLSGQYWRGEGDLIVTDKTGQRLVTLPIAFLRQGQVLKWAYVQEQCTNTFEEQGRLQRKTGEAIGTDEPVTAGEVVFMHAGDKPCQPRRGPRFKFKYRSPNAADDDASTMSNSARSTAQQSKFRFSLGCRDGVCLISDEWASACTAGHILPQSRPEYYTEVLGPSATYLFLPSYGLFLRSDLHTAFDRGEIALYPRGDDLVVHFFVFATANSRAYHGKVIPPSRFRGSPDDRPDTDLLRFHYQQCAMKHLRGYAAGMAPPDPTNTNN